MDLLEGVRRAGGASRVANVCMRGDPKSSKRAGQVIQRRDLPMIQIWVKVDALDLIQYLPSSAVQLLEFGLQTSGVQTAEQVEKLP